MSKNSLLRNLLWLATINWWALIEPSWQWKVKSVNPSWILDFLMGTWSWNLIKFPTNPDGSEFSDLKYSKLKTGFFFQHILNLPFHLLNFCLLYHFAWFQFFSVLSFSCLSCLEICKIHCTFSWKKTRVFFSRKKSAVGTFIVYDSK